MLNIGDVVEIVRYNMDIIQEGNCSREEIYRDYKLGDKMLVKDLYDHGCLSDEHCSFFKKYNCCGFFNDKFGNRIGRPCYIEVGKSQYSDRDIAEINKYKKRIEEEDKEIIGEYSVGVLKQIAKIVSYDCNKCFDYKDGVYYFSEFSDGSISIDEYSKYELENIIKNYNIEI